MAPQEVLSCQSWWQLGMLPGRQCGCLDIFLKPGDTVALSPVLT